MNARRIKYVFAVSYLFDNAYISVTKRRTVIMLACYFLRFQPVLVVRRKFTNHAIVLANERTTLFRQFPVLDDSFVFH